MFLGIIRNAISIRSYSTAMSFKSPVKMLSLSNIQLPPGSHKSRKKRQSAMKGSGNKGWKGRHSGARVVPAFEGGQSTIIKRMPKLGIQKRQALMDLRQDLRVLEMDVLQKWIEMGRLDATKKITIKELVKSKVCGSIKDGVVLLAKGGDFFKSKIDIEVTKASVSAIKIIESFGGCIKSVYTDKARIHAIMNPEKYVEVPDMILPPTLRLLGMYCDHERRGYLNEYIKDVEPKDMIDAIAQKTGLTIPKK